MTDPHRLTGSSHMPTRTSDEAQPTLRDTLGGEVLRDGSTLYVLNRLGYNYWWATLSASGDEHLPSEKHEAVAEAMRAALNSHAALKAENERLRAELAKYTDPVWWHNPPTARSEKNAEDAFAIGDRLDAEIGRLRARAIRYAELLFSLMTEIDDAAIRARIDAALRDHAALTQERE